ncbi:type II secretion system GspH family protein [Patescibacteria group bacterium]|nr:type II secretion system GspH family protein [Patescibacteria group bacterium]
MRNRALPIRGFTLIEMLVSVAIFSVVMVVALGALLSLSEANRRAELLSQATNNFNSSIDSMTRAIRTGSQYHSGTGTLTTLRDTPDANGDTQFAFLPSGGSQVTVYKYNSGVGCPNSVAGCILRSQDGGSTYAAITSPDIIITSLKFYVIGAPQGVQTVGAQSLSVQPKVEILISGYVTVKGGVTSSFNVQTSVTQRLYDL